MLNTSCHPCCRIHLGTWMPEEMTSFAVFVVLFGALLRRLSIHQEVIFSLDNFVVLVLVREFLLLSLMTMLMIAMLLVHGLFQFDDSFVT